MSRLQRSSINMVASMAGYGAPMVINLIATPLLLHRLGEAAYGLQSLVGVIVGYLMLMDMALDMPINKFLAEDRAQGDVESQNRLLSTALQLYGVIGLIGMLTIMLMADLFARRVFSLPPELVGPAVTIFYLAGIGFFAHVLTMWGRAVAAGLQRYDIVYAGPVLVSLTGVGIGLGVVYAGYGVVGYVQVTIIVSLVFSLVYLLIAPRLLPDFRLHWGLDRPMLRRIREYVGSGVLLRVTGLLTRSVDRTLIGAWAGVAALAIYVVPLSAINALGSMIGSMFHFFLPMSSELYSTSRFEELRNLYTRATRFVTALATITFVPMLVLGDAFLMLWVGPSVATRATNVFRLLLLAGYLGILTVALANNVMIGMGHIRAFTIYSLARGFTIAAGCVVLIRPLGIEGAGLSLLMAGAVDVVFLIVTLRRLHISPAAIFCAAYLRPILLGGGIGGLAILARPLATSWLGLGLVLGWLGLCYVGVGYWIGVFGETEKRAVVGFWQMVKKATSRADQQVR